MSRNGGGRGGCRRGVKGDAKHFNYISHNQAHSIIHKTIHKTIVIVMFYKRNGYEPIFKHNIITKSFIYGCVYIYIILYIYIYICMGISYILGGFISDVYEPLSESVRCLCGGRDDD